MVNMVATALFNGTHLKLHHDSLKQFGQYTVVQNAQVLLCALDRVHVLVYTHLHSGQYYYD